MPEWMDRNALRVIAIGLCGFISLMGVLFYCYIHRNDGR